jgi:YlmC/YmxH family sporulation protein
MLLSDIGEKEIINIHDGSKLGIVADTDMVIDGEGKIRALLLAPRFRMFKGKGHNELKIPWGSVTKVGDDILFVDLKLRGKYY